MTALYRIPLEVQVMFEGEGRPDLDLRSAQVRTAMLRISEYVLHEWGLSVEYQFGKPVLLARRKLRDDIEEEAWELLQPKEPSGSASGRSKSKRSG